MEAMCAGTEPGRERERFWTALGNLRSILRTATGNAELKAIRRDGLRYRVDRELFAVDLWQFQAAVAAAGRTELDTAVVAALTQAGDAYTGVLLDGTPYDWVEVPRGPAAAGSRRYGPPGRAPAGQRRPGRGTAGVGAGHRR